MVDKYEWKILEVLNTGKEEEFFKELVEREGKSTKIRELVIVPFLGDAFAEAKAGHTDVAAEFIYNSFPEDSENLTRKLFDSVYREIMGL